MTTGSLEKSYAGRRVLVTGHTGFKGAWLNLWLQQLGAEVIGISDGVLPDPNFFTLAGAGRIDDRRADIRDVERIFSVMQDTKPELAFHLAAQPIVRVALAHPFATISVNVLGTAAVLEASRRTPGVVGVVVVTSDKVYADGGFDRPFRETDPLGGKEPYAASKAAAELVAAVYRHASFHRAAASVAAPRVATARAGNVIGGGDFGRDRLLPDVVRAVLARQDVTLRYPKAIRPWQHVLEPLSGYLVLGQALMSPSDAAPDAVNFGPASVRECTVHELVDMFLAAWGSSRTKVAVDEGALGAETHELRVDSSLAATTLGWRPVWDTARAVNEAAMWYRSWIEGNADLREESIRQIADYTRDAGEQNLRWAGAP